MLPNQFKLRQELAELLQRYNIDTYTDISSYELSKRLVDVLVDATRVNTKSSLWNEQNKKI